MSLNKVLNKFISIGLIACSSLIGIRLINEYLRYADQPKYKFESSIRAFNDGSKLRVAHPQNYKINTTGKDTVVFVSDSFGEGRKCGNSNNIAGCLSRLNPEKKIINLSFGGQTPAFYLQQIKKYFSNQKENRKSISGEKVIISLYSNDIVLDHEYCNFYNLNKSRLKSLMTKNEFDRLNETCDSILSLTLEEYYRTRNYKIIFENQLSNIIGDYSFLVFREFLAQLNLKFSINKSLGRAKYSPIWQNHDSGEVILLVEVLKEIVNTCREFKCKLLITTFPNVENLSPNSKVRSSLLSFSKFMKVNHNIIIHDGYEPFIEKKIKKATYNLLDIHSNCKGYQIYANWLANI